MLSCLARPHQKALFIAMDAIAGFGFGLPLTFLTVIAQFAVSVISRSLASTVSVSGSFAFVHCTAWTSIRPSTAMNGRKTVRNSGTSSSSAACGGFDPIFTSLTEPRCHP